MPCPIALPDANTGMPPRNVRSRFAGTRLQKSCSNGSRCFAQWLENSAEQDVHLPVERCYEMWEDRERIPQWMPWIQSVKVLFTLLEIFTPNTTLGLTSMPIL